MPVKLATNKNSAAEAVGGFSFTAKKESYFRTSPAEEFRRVNDLFELEQVTLHNVLDCLVERYAAGIFYTYAGSMLISLNPCKSKSRNSLTDQDHMSQLRQYDDFSKKNLNHYPHVFSVGEKSLNALRTFGNSQVIVVSGDSGAGKTTLTQQLLWFLIDKSNRVMEMKIPKGLDKKIYFATLILESLGNASTISNSNSSRFGRFIQLNYDVNWSCIIGAKLRTCLLEKHRASKFAKNERTFHIFYYILVGLETGLLKLSDILTKTDGPVNWKTQIPLYFFEGVDASDESQFQTLYHALQSLNLTSELDNIFRIVYGIMMLISIRFVPLHDEHSLDEDDSYETKEFVPEDKSVIRIIGDIFSVHPDIFTNILVSRTITVYGGRAGRQSIFRKPCNTAGECEARVAALTSLLYNKLFHHILTTINSLFKTDTKNYEFQDKNLKMETISLLDLYGFENLGTNHLEQLCINYANERLQLLHLQIMKKYVNEIEDLERGFVPTELNKLETESLERLQSIHESVFLVLNEECLLNRNISEIDVFQRVTKLTTKNPFIDSKNVHNANCPFVIKHYAMEVQYTFAGMVTKNSDNTPSEFQELFMKSSNPFLQHLFNEAGDKPSLNPKVVKGGNRREKTILQRFKISVDELVTELSNQETQDIHFIRCIRPNDNLTFGKITTTVVKKQLFSSGIVDVIRITGNGYPIRILQSKLGDNFRGIMTILFSYRSGGFDVTTSNLVDMLGFKAKDMRIGRTKVLLTQEAYEFLKRLESTLIRRSITRLQRSWRAVMKRKQEASKYRNSNWLTMTSNHELSTSTSRMNTSIGSYGDISSKNLNIDLVPENANLEIGTYDLIPSVQHLEPWKPRVTFDELFRIMENLNLRSHEGIVTRGQLSKIPVRFHTRKTPLSFSHCRPKSQGLNEILRLKR